MPTLVIIIAILGAVVGFLDFMVGGPGDRRMKQGLVDFYVATEAGDWTALYRHPARALLSFMQRWFGRHRFAVRYFLMTCMISISLTTILFVFSMTWSYIHALKTETSCAVPVFARFLQIPAYMSPFLIYIMLVNIIVDYLSWSLAQLALETLADSRGRKALLLILSMLVAAVLILFAIYTIYLPLSLTVQLRDMGINIPVSGFFQILSANIHQNWQLFRLPQPLFHIDCTTRPYSVFSITYVGTMQILALETMLPMILLIIATSFGLFAYFLRPIIRKPLSFVIERLEGSPKHVVLLVGGFVIGVLTLLAAVKRNAY